MSKKVILIMLSLFDKFKRDHFWGPFLKASGGSTKISIHFYSSEQFLFYFDKGSHDLVYEKLTNKDFEKYIMTIPIYFYQRHQQISIFDKFQQDFRNSQILWKFDKSLSATRTTTTTRTTKSFLRTLPQYLLAFKNLTREYLQ